MIKKTLKIFIFFILLSSCFNCFIAYSNNTDDKGPVVNEVKLPLTDEEMYKQSLKNDNSINKNGKNKDGSGPVVVEIQKPLSDTERQANMTVKDKGNNENVDSKVYFAFSNDTLYLSSLEFGDEYALKGKITKSDEKNSMTNSAIMIPWESYGVDITKIVKVTIMNAINPYQNCCIFAGMEKLISIENLEFYKLNGWNSLKDFFYGCKSLTEIDLSKLDTKNIIDWSYMFDGCEKFELINLTNIDMTNAEDLSYMFNNCINLKMVAVKNDSLSKVKTMHKMFKGCSSLEKIDLSIWFLNDLEEASYLFSDCTSLIYVNLNNPTTKKLKDISYMLNNCVNLDSVNMNQLDISNIVDVRGMFSNTEFITKVEFNHMEMKNPNINAEDMYSGCKSLEYPDIYVVKNNLKLMRVFNECPNIKEVDISFISCEDMLDVLGLSGMSNIEKITLRKGQKINGIPSDKKVYID